jgi:hypothetical protein
MDESALREQILRLGRMRLGPPDEAVAVAVKRVSDLGQLKKMLERVLTVRSWQELLATP